ncbi:hypothetical protein GGI19_000187 [Coemansia pectinata]|uniref:Uncharacterized protein n=1 Tax=Coemansia pectinata TaxID=1052879 RepID=A0A9W8H1D2_9FUNG|nr:hypothetical protein GGI19_000187 [Coemansia pectinata]
MPVALAGSHGEDSDKRWWWASEDPPPNSTVVRATMYLSALCTWSLLLLAERVSHSWSVAPANDEAEDVLSSQLVWYDKPSLCESKDFVTIEFPTDMHLEKVDYTALDLFWPPTPPTSLESTAAAAAAKDQPQIYGSDISITTAEPPPPPPLPGPEILGDKMGAVESLPSLSYHDHRHHHNHNHRLFGSGDRQTATPVPAASTGNKPVRSATVCLSSCASGPGDDSGDLLTGDKGQIKRASTARGLFRASLRRYSYRTPANWIHGKEKSGAADAGVGCLGVASNRMPSAEDIRIGSSYTRSIDAVVPQLSASMPHLPTHVESLRTTQLPPLATNVRGKKGSTSIVAATESIPFPTIEFAAGDNSAVANFEGSGEQAPNIAASSGIAEFRQKLARRLSRSSRQSHRRGGNAASSQHKRTSATDDDINASNKRALSVESDLFAATTSADSRQIFSSELDSEGMLAKGLGLLHIRETGESLDMPLAFVTSSSNVASTDSDSGSRLLSESIDCLLEMRLFQAMGETHSSSNTTSVGQTVVEADVVPKLQTLSASSSMSSLSTSASSSLTLSGDEPLAESRPAVQLQVASGYSGVSASGAEILDYEDFMYLSACENHRPRLLPSATSTSDDDSAVRITSRAKGTSGDDDEDARKWWPRCVMPAQNMQYMPKLSLMFAREGHVKLIGDRHHSSESIPLPWLQSDSPRLLRARSEGAIGKTASAGSDVGDAMGYTANGVRRRMDFWDVLGRCPMRPTSSLALASLKDMAKSCADACGYVGNNRKSDCENRGAEDSGYVASSLADSASDSDEDSDSDGESAPAYGMLLGLSAKQSPSTMQRGNGIGPQQRGGSSNTSNKHRTKRVLSEPMQYILYNSYLRYYGRPGEAQ